MRLQLVRANWSAQEAVELTEANDRAGNKCRRGVGWLGRMYAGNMRLRILDRDLCFRSMGRFVPLPLHRWNDWNRNQLLLDAGLSRMESFAASKREAAGLAGLSRGKSALTVY